MTVHLVPNDVDGVIAMCYRIRQRFIEAEDLPETPMFARLIDDPDAMAESALNHCRRVMRENGEMHPVLFLFSRQAIQAVVMSRGLPTTLLMQAALASSLRVTIVSSPIEAYWVASEAWSATYSEIPDESAADFVAPSDRPDRREMLVLVTASATHFRTTVFETRRGEAGVIELAPTGLVDGLTSNLMFSNLFDRSEEVLDLAKNLRRGK